MNNNAVSESEDHRHLPCKYRRRAEMLECRKVCIQRGNRVLEGADSQKSKIENVKGGFESARVVKTAGKVY